MQSLATKNNAKHETEAGTRHQKPNSPVVIAPRLQQLTNTLHKRQSLDHIRRGNGSGHILNSLDEGIRRALPGVAAGMCQAQAFATGRLADEIKRLKPVDGLGRLAFRKAEAPGKLPRRWPRPVARNAIEDGEIPRPETIRQSLCRDAAAAACNGLYFSKEPHNRTVGRRRLETGHPFRSHWHFQRT